ncbi:arsenic transport integral membrane protein ArsB [Cellulomonas chitinilytica]|uniref:Arsenic transport integral membrane protein ArsB n=1 Tax=Cellulomonas chitinilytica TaxID=398759 RepID=A0A919TZW8_9CELL|nr:arsenic transport integral membrane protein ArsB [Cellulomonas chitinilytica]
MPWWLVSVVVTVVVVATGALPADDARALAERTVPILVFLAALTVVAEMCAGAGVFTAAAELAALVGRGRRAALWLLVVLLATVSTAVLSLDTTAVLLTPVVITLARHTRTPPLPFALAVLALSNTASLLLPVSNLTNLLADHVLRAADVGFIGLMWAPALAAVLTTVAVLAVRDRHVLSGTYEVHPGRPAPDRPLLVVAAVVTGVMAAAFVAGLPVAPTALAAAAILMLATRLRRRPWPVPPSRLVPWRTLVVVAGLFAVVQTAHAHGLGALLADAAGHGHGAADLLRVAGVGAASSNAVNNLPAYLALEPATGGDPLRIAALLIGTGAGPLVTPWGSLATVLWWHRCRQVMLDVPAGTIVRQGLLLAPVVVVAATLALVAAH